MKPRHAAALALVGWYLMMPPFTERHEINTDAPLTKWERLDSYSSAGDCAADRSILLRDSQNKSKAADLAESTALRQGKVWDRTLAIARLEASRCIASDDPRLKEK